MYCPVCLNTTLYLNNKGVAELYINKKHLDNGKFLFNVHEKNQEMNIILEKKVTEFFQWYSRLNNIEPIEQIEIVTNAFSCSSKCRLNVLQKFSLIGILYPPEIVFTMVKKLATKFNLKVQLKIEDDSQ